MIALPIVGRDAVSALGSPPGADVFLEGSEGFGVRQPWSDEVEVVIIVLAVAALVAGFVYLPEALGNALLIALMVFVLVLAMPAEAHARGFRWWLWAVPNFIGFVLVFVVPSARDPDLSAEEQAIRARRGDVVGAMQTVFTVVFLAAGLILAKMGQ